MDSSTRHRRRLGGGAAVEDTRPDQLLELGDLEPAVGGAGREDHRAGADLAAVGEADVEAVAVAPKPVASCMKANFAPKTHACS